jgi:hypothetical protein
MWEVSQCTGRQGRGLQKEVRLDPDNWCIGKQTGFDLITLRA